MASLALVSKYGISPLDWQKVMARLFEICRTVSTLAHSAPKNGHAYHSLALVHVNLVANNDLHIINQQSSPIITPATGGQLTKGKLSGSRGDAWIRNSSRQLSRASKLFALLTSYTRTQQSAPR